jgi:hypothetical protein
MTKYEIDKFSDNNVFGNNSWNEKNARVDDDANFVDKQVFSTKYRKISP